MTYLWTTRIEKWNTRNNEETTSSHEVPILIFKIVLLKSVSIFKMILDHYEGILKDWKSLIGHENCFHDGVKSWLHIIKLKSKELNTSYQWDWYKAITPIWLDDDCDVHN